MILPTIPEKRETPIHFGKSLLLASLATGALLAAVPAARAAIIIDWGSVVPSTVVTSYGDVVPTEGFHFELGVFDSAFTPTQGNRDDWFDNWVIFDGIGPDAPDNVDFEDNIKYNKDLGYFTSTADFLSTGLSGSQYSGADNTYNFANQQAWLWIRNATTMVAGSEWLLVRSTLWVFPDTYVDEDNEIPPVEWSISDLVSTDDPLYGRHANSIGPGERTANPTGPPYGDLETDYLLQTYTIPEPGVLPLGLLAATALLLRRQRRA